jgi:hypothetical protein
MKEKTILLKDRLDQINLSPVTEPVHMGEITLALNVIKRVKNQSPEIYEKVLDMIAEQE